MQIKMLQVRQSETKMHEEKLLVQIHHLFLKKKEKSHKAVYSVKENMVISVWIFSKSN